MLLSGRLLALLVASSTLMGVRSIPPKEYPHELLSQLDPTRRLSDLCGGANGGGAMRDKLMQAAAILRVVPARSTPLYDHLGHVDFRITTASPLAKLYFNQGLSFAYGFNHAAAIASFREAQKLDPACALCFWGEALAHGPNINAPMDPGANERAVQLARHAHILSARSSAHERALTTAMLTRYSAAADGDRARLDAAYADAMLAAAAAYPEIDDMALLAAEAAMDTRPWDYWHADRRTPHVRIGEAVGLVETVLARNVDHPQAAHLYIHLMENGSDPRKAEAAADRLAAPLAPRAGHLVHMPAHIYYRVGRWKDSMRVNIQAARADADWIRMSGDNGLVRYGYYPHNVHFIVASAQMAGDMRTAIREARRLETLLDPETASKIAWVQAISAAPFFAAAQFATSTQILAINPPDRRMPYAAAMRHFARAVAFAHRRNKPAFDRELAALREVGNSGALKPMVEQNVPAPELLRIAEWVARGRWAEANRQHRAAAAHYREAIAIEQAIPYMEPPFWYYPIHQSLGAALYGAGRYEEARKAFTVALAQSPGNGWALYGLARTEVALGNDLEAAAATAALKRAWAGDPKWLRMDRL